MTMRLTNIMLLMRVMSITWNAWMMIAAMMTKTRLTRVSQTRVAIQ